MDLFKLLGKIVIDNTEANKELTETQSKAKETATAIQKSNQTTQSSNKTTGSSWSDLKSKVNEYKAQGLSTSEAWRKASNDMKSSTEGAGNGMTGTFAKIGAAIGTYLVVDKVIAFGQGCITAAADASAMESQFSQVFGDLESKASKSLTSIADTSGISENRMKGSFTKIAAFAKTTGMDTEDALGLSERAMVAVADSAAFYDRSLEDTTESLQSFLKGNYENDAALGLSCTEVTRNEAANKLYGKSFKDLSESQKQLTLLQMVEDANKASGALGQAARESDTWTNVTGNLKQTWTDFQAILGEAVLPKAVGIVKGLASAVEGLGEKTKATIQWVKEHKTEMTLIGIAMGTVGAAIAGYNIYINASTIATKAHTAATWLANTATTAFGSVMAFLTSPVTLVILAIGALVAAVVVMYNKFDWFKDIVDSLKEKFVNGFNAMKDAVSNAVDNIKEKIAPVVSAIKENLVGAFEDLKKAGQGIRDAMVELKEKFQPVADFISGAFSSAVSGASDWFDKLTDKVGNFAKGALEWLNDKITAVREGFSTFCDFAGRLWDNLDPLVTLIRDNLLNTLENLKEPIASIKEAFDTIGDTILNHLLPTLRDALMPIWEALKPILTAVAGILGGALAVAFGIATGVINGIVSAVDGFVQAFSGIVEVVSGVFELIVGIFTGNSDLCKEAIQGIWDGVCDVFGGLWDAVSGYLQGFVDGVVGFFQGLWDTLVGHSIVPDTINGVIGCFSGLWEGVSGFVSGFVDNVTGFFGDMKDKAVEKAGELKDKAVEKFGELKDAASEKWSNIKTAASDKWDSIKSTVSEKASGLKDKASDAFSKLKDKVSSASSSAKDKASSAWNTLKDKTSSAFSSAKDKASSAWDTLKNKVSASATGAKDKASSVWNNLKDKTSSAFSGAKDKAASAFSILKNKITSDASSATSSAGQKFSSMKSKISSVVDSTKSKAASAFSSMKSSISTHAGGALSTVSSKFNSIKSKISSVMDSAKSAVSSGISTMKNKFNFKWSLPKLKMPHFKVSGKFSLNPPSIPKFSISWYKKAYDNAMLLNSPTIFGYSAASGKLLGGGDGNGSEVVAGSQTLMNMIQAAVATQNEVLVYYLQKLIEILASYFPQVIEAMDRDVVLDSGALVGEIAIPMNRALGKLSTRKDRGR